MGKVYDLSWTVGCMDNLLHNDQKAPCHGTVRQTPHAFLTHSVLNIKNTKNESIRPRLHGTVFISYRIGYCNPI